VLVSPDCPIAQKYSLTLRKIESEYSENGIHVYGIMPGTYYSLKEMNKFRKKYKVNFPLLQDPNYKIPKWLEGTITPEVFLLNSSGEVVYRGAIDNWFFALGKKRAVITETYLIDAIEAVLADKPIAVSKTDVVGCILEY